MRSKHFLGMGLLGSGFVALALLGAGCGGSGDTGSGGSGGSGGNPSSTSSTTSTTTTTTTTSSTGGPMSDGNDNFDQAVDLDPTGSQDSLQDPKTDNDFFKFEGTAGDIYVITASSHPQGTEMDAGYIDTFIELYDSNKALLATNDDRYPRNSTDSEIVTILPTTGTYYLKIQEWCISPQLSAMSCDDAYFDELINLDYVIGATKLDPTMAAGGTAVETEPNESSAAASDVTPAFAPVSGMAGSYYLTITSGKLPGPTDQDWYKLTIPSDLVVDAAARAKLGIIMPWGSTAGNGSNVKFGKVDIFAGDGTTVVASFDMSAEPNDLFDRADIQTPVVIGDDYFVKVTRGSTNEDDGAGDFYFVYSTMGAGNPLESEPNDTNATAEVLDLATGTVGSYFVEGDLSGNDVDIYKIATQGQETISIACSAQRTGSGIRGFKATVFQADGTTAIPMGSQTETPSANLFVDHVDISAAAQVDLIIKIEATLPADATNTGTYYICGFHAGAPVM